MTCELCGFEQDKCDCTDEQLKASAAEMESFLREHPELEGQTPEEIVEGVISKRQSQFKDDN